MNILKINGVVLNLDNMISVSIKDESSAGDNDRPDEFKFTLRIAFARNDEPTNIPIDIAIANCSEYSKVLNYVNTQFAKDIQKGGFIDLNTILERIRTDLKQTVLK